MDKFQYILGWVALIGSVLAVIAFIVAALIDSEGAGYVVVRLIWMPFVFLWGLHKVREYQQENKGGK